MMAPFEHRSIAAKIYSGALFSLIIACICLFSPVKNIARAAASITRLTYMDADKVFFPAISGDGRNVAFFTESRREAGEKIIIRRSLKVVSSTGGAPRTLFEEGRIRAPEPNEDMYLMMGTKPPVISRDGRWIAFSLSVGKPLVLDIGSDVISPRERITLKDHYLGIVSASGGDLKVVEFKNKALAKVNWRAEGFSSDTWERVACYQISGDGAKVACVVKGCFGPRRFGVPSAVVLYDVKSGSERSVMAPVFKNGKWVWNTYPASPMTGGGWALAFSADGKRLVVGARSSDRKDDYDLYEIAWDSEEIKRITRFSDKLISAADISNDGRRIVFFYGGMKEKGIGTYMIDGDNPPVFLRSASIGRIDFVDMAGSGKKLFYRSEEGGLWMDLDSGREYILFEAASVSAKLGIKALDYPAYAFFWSPSLASDNGEEVILMAIPEGKSIAEIYIMRMKQAD